MFLFLLITPTTEIMFYHDMLVCLSVSLSVSSTTQVISEVS